VVEINRVGNIAFGTSADRIPGFDSLVPPRVRNAAPGALYEWRPVQVALELSRRIARDRGVALVIDYGHAESGLGETLQAVGEHAYADPLVAPGIVDLTAHVDFEALTHAAESMGVYAHGPLTQGEFLHRLGIEARAAALKANATPEVANGIDAALARLTGMGRTDMGALFKVMALTDPTLNSVPGFEQ
jgi:SAM-dependent MidA family methyltransferase